MLKKTLNALIALYLFLLPWQAVYIFAENFINGAKWQYGTGQIYLTEPLLWLIALIFVSGRINSRGLKSLVPDFKLLKSADKKRMAITSAIWLFVLWSGLSILWSPEKPAACYLWLHLLEGAALMLIILNSGWRLKNLLWPLIASAGPIALLAVWQFLTQNSLANTLLGLSPHSAAILGDTVIETDVGRWLRAYGPFSHPNILGGYLALTLSAVLILWQEIAWSSFPSLKRESQRIFLLVVICLISASLFFSFSRSAWLAALIILMICLGYWLKNKKLWPQYLAIILAPLLIFATLSFIFNPLVLARADLAGRLENNSLAERETQVSQALGLIKNQPLLGAGLNNYTYALHRQSPLSPAYSLQPVHNLYLLILAELGVIGLIISLVLFYLIIKNSKKSFALLPLTALLIISLFDHYFFTQYIGLMIFWLALTLALVDDKVENQ
ncbi:MAG: O-antigen ligase family protein [Patescibacteria group bacterium]|jgi:O-antigen ligase